MSVEAIIYLCAFIVGFSLTFMVLRALHIEEKFQKGKINFIKLGFFLFSIIGGHIIGDFALTLFNLFKV